jgi:hypothetical protein
MAVASARVDPAAAGLATSRFNEVRATVAPVIVGLVIVAPEIVALAIVPPETAAPVIVVPATSSGSE